MDKRWLSTCGVFIDLKKAFDIVYHKIPLPKLDQIVSELVSAALLRSLYLI